MKPWCDAEDYATNPYDTSNDEPSNYDLFISELKSDLNLISKLAILDPEGHPVTHIKHTNGRLISIGEVIKLAELYANDK